MPSILPVLRPLLAPASMAAAGPVLVKSIGSAERWGAEKRAGAPDHVLKQTASRETSLIAASTVFTAIGSKVSKMLPGSSVYKNFGSAALGVLLAEELCRRVLFPMDQYGTNGEPVVPKGKARFDDDDDYKHHDHHNFDDDDAPRIGSRLNVVSQKDPLSFSQAFSKPTTPARPNSSSQFSTSQMFNAPMKPSSFSVSV
jgi:hypothetical protein